MNKKEMKKFAQRIAEQELIHQNPSSSSEAKAQAEAKIMELTNRICSTKDGFQTMMTIDEMVQQLLEKINL